MLWSRVMKAEKARDEDKDTESESRFDAHGGWLGASYPDDLKSALLEDDSLSWMRWFSRNLR